MRVLSAPGLQRDQLLRDAVRQAQDARHSRHLGHHVLHVLATQRALVKRAVVQMLQQQPDGSRTPPLQPSFVAA